MVTGQQGITTNKKRRKNYCLKKMKPRIRKGRGTAPKDISHVAYKLARKKCDDTFKLLHSVLFARKGKNNVSRFSGFVWHDNEEKQIQKVKEKLDKYVKEKLLEFCDAINSRKEDIIVNLVEFCVEPQATTSEKEQTSKGNRRKRVGKSTSGTGNSTPSKGLAKSRKIGGSDSKKSGGRKSMASESEDELGEEKEEAHEDVIAVDERSEDEMSMSEQSEAEEKESESDDNKGKRSNLTEASQKKGGSDSKESGGTKSMSSESEDESGEEKEEAHEDTNAVDERSEDEMSMSEQSEAEEKESESDDDKGKKKRVVSATSRKIESGGKAKTKRETISKKASPPPKRAPEKSSPSQMKNNDASAKFYSGTTGKKVLKVKDKLKERKSEPSDDDLRNAICELIKVADFSTVTFTDILKQLVNRFKTNLASRKHFIKGLVQVELTKLVDAAEADDEEEDGDEGDVEKNKKEPATKRFMA